MSLVMKTLTFRTIFRCTASSSTTPPLYSQCLIFYSSSTVEFQKRRRATAQPSSSSSLSPSSSSSSWRHHYEDSRNVKVSVWWDFENCSIPTGDGINVFKVTQRITSALRANGIKGPVTITAFGDVMQLSRSNQEALSSTGVCLNHIPHGGKNSADRTLMTDLVFWVSQNPPPAHLFLISGDRDFANVLHRLRMNNYNILLASTNSAPGVLCSAASIVWQWNALVRGENLIGRHFNQPPDGPYGSWYGYHKGPLEDPFSDMEQPPCSSPEESLEAGTDSTTRPVPKAFLSQIRQILNLYPKGIPISTLRAELAKSNVTMDKDFFGHKKFSRLLLSLPTVLKLRPAGAGQTLVHGIHPNSVEPAESNSKISIGPETNNGDGNQGEIVEQNGGDRGKTPDVDEKSWSLPGKLKTEELPPVGQKENDEPSTISHPTGVEKQDLTSELGILPRIWRLMFGYKEHGWNEKGDRIPEKCSTSDSSKKTKSEENSLESPNCPTSASSCSPSSNAAHSDQAGNVTKDSGEIGEKSSTSTGLFNKIINWCRFWGTSGNPDNNENGQCCKELKKRKELFSQGFFWSGIDLFIHSPKGSVLVCQSKTREQMAQKLQKEGPVVLNNLSENDLLHLVDLLISEKKWVEEYPSQTFPFKLIRHVRTESAYLPGSNRLSSFSSKLSQSWSKSQGLPEFAMEKRDQNQFQNAICSTESNKKSSGTGKAKHEILADCQKLVTEILKEYPEGFTIRSFNKLFEDRYGYILDYQQLGYSQLAALLQVMPEVKIESTYILPAKKASGYPGPDTTFPCSMESDTGRSSNADGELSDLAREDNDCETVWEELGPISETYNRNDAGSRLNGESKKEIKEQLYFSDDYLSDDELSDWEGESVTLDQSEDLLKSRITEEDSSLLQILDSWYSSKDASGYNDRSQKAEELVDCIGSTLSHSSGVEMNNKAPVATSGHKVKPMKKYSFVSEPVTDGKQKLIDNKLGGLKKSAETRAETRAQG